MRAALDLGVDIVKTSCVALPFRWSWSPHTPSCGVCLMHMPARRSFRRSGLRRRPACGPGFLGERTPRASCRIGRERIVVAPASARQDAGAKLACSRTSKRCPRGFPLLVGCSAQVDAGAPRRVAARRRRPSPAIRLGLGRRARPPRPVSRARRPRRSFHDVAARSAACRLQRRRHDNRADPSTDRAARHIRTYFCTDGSRGTSRSADTPDAMLRLAMPSPGPSPGAPADVLFARHSHLRLHERVCARGRFASPASTRLTGPRRRQSSPT